MSNAISGPPLMEADCPFCERRVLVYEDPPRCPLCACPIEQDRMSPFVIPAGEAADPPAPTA
ncbi:MAG TPA: hypothetical protein VNN79_16230 [Actinomycetota bacterium]|nr:hypothetical protein [Actinomycetota bacterium]